MLEHATFSLNMVPVLAWAAITKYHRLDGLHNMNYFLTVPEAGSVSSGCQHDQVLVRLSSWHADNCLLAVSSPGLSSVLPCWDQGREREGSSLVSHLIRTLILS